MIEVTLIPPPASTRAKKTGPNPKYNHFSSTETGLSILKLTTGPNTGQKKQNFL